MDGNILYFYLFVMFVFLEGEDYRYGGKVKRREIPQHEINEDVRLFDDRKKRWKDLLKENIQDKGKVHTLRWEI